MAYVRDDQKASRYKALQRELQIVEGEIAVLSNTYAAENVRLYTLKRSLERRMDELKIGCHLLQR